MARRPQDVTDAELAVLQVLWEQGQANRRVLAEAIYPGGGVSSYTTIQKLLERLEAKGCVERRSSAEGVLFSARVDRQQLIGRRLRDVAEKLCGGSLTPLLMNLVKAQPLKARELDELKAFVESLKKTGKTKNRPR